MEATPAATAEEKHCCLFQSIAEEKVNHPTIPGRVNGRESAGITAVTGVCYNHPVNDAGPVVWGLAQDELYAQRI